tara:strand:+ start:817 stop:1206 length:390 start_codon:yes stop_codon:yes gene_type:complete
MIIPITKRVNDSRSKDLPVNQEVTKNSDGSGGPVDLPGGSPLKQTKKTDYEEYKSSAKNRFSNFNVDKDTMLVSHHGDEQTSKRFNYLNKELGVKAGTIKPGQTQPKNEKLESNKTTYRYSTLYNKSSN